MSMNLAGAPIEPINMRRVALKPRWHPARIANSIRIRVSPWYHHRAPLAEAPDMAGHRFLFVGGVHRSGTSVLYRMLRSHPDVSGFANTGVPEDEGQTLQSIFPIGWVGRFAFMADGHLTEDSRLVSPANRAKLLREWCAYLDLAKPVLLEKSPPNVIRARFFQALFPDARFVFIVRHPIAVAASSQKMARTTFAELLLHWYIAHRMMLDDLGKLTHAMVLRYEDLMQEPDQCVGEAFRLADLSAISTTEPIENSNPYYFRFFEQEHPKLGIEEVADLIRPAMARFGYRFAPPFVDPIKGYP